MVEFVRSVPGSAKDFAELNMCEREFVRGRRKQLLDFMLHRLSCETEQMVDRIQVQL